MKVVGHRGWPARYPENTLDGFEAALELGIDCIELDGHVTVDDHVVVIHDEDTDRVAECKVLVRESTLAELKLLDVGAKFSAEFTGARIPTLDEVLDIIADRAEIYLEVKNPRDTTDRLNAKLLPAIRQLDANVIVHSFDADYLRVFRKLCPNVATGFLCSASEQTLAATLELGCDAMHPSWDRLTVKVNRSIRAAGLGIYIWKVIAPDDCRGALDLDVDAIGTDCPDVLMALLAERTER